MDYSETNSDTTKNVSVSHEVSIFIIKLLLSIDRFRLSREVKKKPHQIRGTQILNFALGSRRCHLTYTESSKLLFVLSTESR